MWPRKKWNANDGKINHKYGGSALQIQGIYFIGELEWFPACFSKFSCMNNSCNIELIIILFSSSECWLLVHVEIKTIKHKTNEYSAKDIHWIKDTNPQGAEIPLCNQRFIARNPKFWTIFLFWPIKRGDFLLQFPLLKTC